MEGTTLKPGLCSKPGAALPASPAAVSTTGGRSRCGLTTPIAAAGRGEEAHGLAL